ncbi:MAG: hypothetical protein EXQ47_04070 [Bryobacterales bacterium]|nr:hypothetical protein [Bryobacterales bacterium]
MSPSSPTRREALAALLAVPVASLAASPTQWTLQQASQQIRAKKISPVELTRTCLDRIELLNPRLNAFITIMAEQALTQARALESELHADKWRGPLHGIPIGLKDLLDTVGVKTTCASAVFADRVPTQDAEVVRRLKLAGAVLVGKQNMQEFAHGGTSVPSHYGAVHNPWDITWIAGGSSGGSAAAVAAGLCFGALGSDTGGSIRQPSAYCGTTGLKPTYGRVSTRGVVPLSWSLDHIGPMCRTVADTAFLLEAIAGYDPFEPASVDWPTERYANALGGKRTALRVGLVRRPFFQQLDTEIEAAVNVAIDLIGRLAVEVRDVELPPTQELNIVVLGPEAYAFHAPYFHQDSGPVPSVDSRAVETGRECQRSRLRRGSPRAGSVAAVGRRHIFSGRSAGHPDYADPGPDHRGGGSRRTFAGRGPIDPKHQAF